MFSSEKKLQTPTKPDDSYVSHFNPKSRKGNFIMDTPTQTSTSAVNTHMIKQFNDLKKKHPDALLLVHPECPTPIQKVADVIGSTAGLLNFAIKDEATEFIVATESGILHEMTKACPEKTFIPAPPEATESIGCSCNECAYMKLNTLNKLYNTLKYEWPAIEVDPQIAEKAIRPIDKMLEISKNLKSAMANK